MERESALRLGDSWLLELRASRKSPNTIRSYGASIRQFVAWCDGEGIDPDLTKPTVNAYVASLLEEGAEGATAAARQVHLRRWSKWLAEEGEIDADELAGLKPVAVDVKPVDPLTTEECAALVAACEGKTFRDRRDEAIVRVMIETGLRASETVSMTVADTDVQAGTALIRRGKGGKGRLVPFSPFAARAIDRYLRLRRKHRLAGSDALWLGDRGRALEYSGLYQTLSYRAELAGVAGFTLHRLRNTMATRWLEAGGSQDGLMAIAGWSTPAMLHRYVRATQSQRAAEEARRLNLGDF